jgi:hypothetical protein
VVRTQVGADFEVSFLGQVAGVWMRVSVEPVLIDSTLSHQWKEPRISAKRPLALAEEFASVEEKRGRIAVVQSRAIRGEIPADVTQELSPHQFRGVGADPSIGPALNCNLRAGASNGWTA